MAKKTVVLLTDDLDGSDAEETVSFMLDGRTYEIDLSKKNAAKLRKALARLRALGFRGLTGTVVKRGRFGYLVKLDRGDSARGIPTDKMDPA